MEQPQQDRLSQEAWQGSESKYEVVWAEGLRNPELALEGEDTGSR